MGGVLSRTKVDGIMQRKEGRVLCEGLQLLSWNLERQKKRDKGVLKGGWEGFPLEHEAGRRMKSMVPTPKVHGISMNNPVCPTYASDRGSDGLFVNARLGSKMGSLSRRVFTRAPSCY